MRDENRTKRQAQIETAAYALLEEKGYAGASMLAIARRAKASNETLYNWYGDKIGLFKTLVAGNAAQIKQLLETERAAQSNPIDTLQALGPVLLSVLTGARAVALNRAAAADPTGVLGQALAEAGRDTIAPLITQVFEQAKASGALSFDDPALATETFLNLLIGDLQIRRAIGRMPEPSASDRARRSEHAISAITLIYPPIEA